MAYSKELADAICARLAEGESLRKACKNTEGGPAVSTFLLWCSNDAALAEQYARARATGTDAEFEELADLEEMQPERDDKGKIDPGFVAWKKLQIDTKKWALSKKAPRKYGEKLELASDPERPMVHRIENVVIDPKG